MFLGSTFEIHDGANWAGVTGQTDLEYLADFKNTIYTTTTYGTQVNIPTAMSNYFQTVVKVATLHFEFMQGTGYTMVYWIIVVPFVVLPGLLAIFYALYLMLIAILPW